MDKAAREKLVDTAARLFAERGFSRVGINEIIREAGVARMSLYNHFPSKAALALAAYESVSQKRRAAVDAIIDGTDDPREAILAIFDLAERLASEPSFRGCAFVNLAAHAGMAEAELFDLVREHKRRLREHFAQLVSALGHADSELIGRQLLALWDGALSDAHIENDTAPIRAARAGAVALLSR